MADGEPPDRRPGPLRPPLPPRPTTPTPRPVPVRPPAAPRPTVRPPAVRPPAARPASGGPIPAAPPLPGEPLPWAAPAPPGEFTLDVGAVLERTFSAWRANLVPFTILGFMVLGPVYLIQFF